jgi:hypothetical protein
MYRIMYLTNKVKRKLELIDQDIQQHNVIPLGSGQRGVTVIMKSAYLLRCLSEEDIGEFAL